MSTDRDSFELPLALVPGEDRGRAAAGGLAGHLVATLRRQLAPRARLARPARLARLRPPDLHRQRPHCNPTVSLNPSPLKYSNCKTAAPGFVAPSIAAVSEVSFRN